MNFTPFGLFCFVCLSLVVAPLLGGQAKAQHVEFYGLDWNSVRVCPATMTDQTPPDFTSDRCSTAKPYEVDPQGRLIWVRVTVPLGALKGQNGEPLSLYVSGKMSSEVYLNGQMVGRNGMPGASSGTEVPGLMDAQFFPAQDLFRLGDNEVVLRASAHHGFLSLGWPVHTIAIGPSGVYANGSLPRYIPALVTLGLFVVGALYFGTMGVIAQPRARFWILCSICFFAAAQLVSEALRGLVPYAYPVHDLRLLLIAVFSTGFGLSVALHVFWSFAQTSAVKITAGLTIISVVALFFVPSYDFKALVGMTLPLVAALVATGFWSYQRRRRAFLYFVTVLVFVAAIFSFQGLFLDTFFFFLVAFFLLLIFIEQAMTLAEEARERRSEEARADRLGLALEEAQERVEVSEISIKSAGKMERIATSDILHCGSADGYAEIFLTSGRTLLYTTTLNDMEGELPSSFLRVHRSHLINIKYVESLNRDRSGTGILTLTGGVEVPVSRRIMPAVRQALA